MEWSNFMSAEDKPVKIGNRAEKINLNGATTGRALLSMNFT